MKEEPKCPFCNKEKCIAHKYKEAVEEQPKESKHDFNEWNQCKYCDKSVEDYESVEDAFNAKCSKL